MKKLLGILGTIIIAGSGMVGLVGNATAPAKNEVNSLQTNNLENLIRIKRSNFSKYLNVPKIRQFHEWNCAPTSVESVLRYFNIKYCSIITSWKWKFN